MVEKDNHVYHTDLLAYNLRKSVDVYGNLWELNSCIPHPKYDGFPKCGYDIAVCFVKKYLGGRNIEDQLSEKE